MGGADERLPSSAPAPAAVARYDACIVEGIAFNEPLVVDLPPRLPFGYAPVSKASLLAQGSHGRALLNQKDPKEAQRTGQVDGMPNDPITLIKDGRIHYRDIPVQQSLEDWNEFWQEYKNA